MQKLVLGIVCAALCASTPTWAAETSAQPAASTEDNEDKAGEAPPADGETTEEDPSLLGFPPAKKTPPPGGEQAASDGSAAADGSAPASDGTSGSVTATVNTQGADAPGKTPDASTGKLTKNVLLFNQQATRGKSFGLLATISTFAGSGTFIANDFLRHQVDYVAQVLDLRPTFGFNLGTHRLRLQGRVAFETEYTQPNTNPSRRWKPYDTAITLADDTLYTEPVTNILFNTAFRLSLPTSYESINVRQQWLAATLAFGARRLFGPIQLSFSTGVTKYVNGSKFPTRKLDDPRSSDLNLIGVEAQPSLVVNNPGQTQQAGFANNNWLFANNLGVTFLASDNLAISYSVGILSYIKYTADPQLDQFTSVNADPGAPTAQLFQSGLNVSYDLTHFAEDDWGLPFRLTASIGASAVHPVQTTNNKGWIPPVVFNTFFDRAADNYGQIYLDLTAIY